MFAYSGTVQRVALSNALAFVVAAPLLGLLHAAFTALGEKDARGDAAREKASRRACLAGQVLGLAVLGWQAWTAGLEGTALQHVLRLVRVGQLDVSIDLALDATSAAMACGILCVGTAFFAGRARVGLRLAATASLVVAGALLAVLADDALAAALGASVASLAWAASGTRARPGVLPRLADIALAGALAVLFWVQGGTFTDGRFLPDLAPRVVAVTDAPIGDDTDESPAARIDLEGRVTRLKTPDKRASPDDHASLTFDALPGALLYLDEARTPLADADGRPLVAPLVGARLSAGLHTIRVHAGGGLDDDIVSRATFEPGSHVTLALLGPTLAYRHSARALALTPARGAAPAAVLARSPGGLAIGFMLLAVAVLLRAAGAYALSEPDRSRGGAALGPVAGLALAIVVVRFAPLLGLSPLATACVGVLGAACAALGAALAARASTWPELLRGLTFACAATSLAGAALGSRPAAAGMLATGMLGLATLALTIGRHGGALGTSPAKDGVRRTAAWLACAALAGAPVPIAAGTWCLAGCFAPAMATARPAVALLAVLCGAAAAALASFAVWRAYAVEAAPSPHRGSTNKAAAKGAWAALGLAALSLELGAAMAASPRLLGADGDGPLAPWLGGTPAGGAAVLAASLVTLGAALGGFSRARRRGSASLLADASALQDRGAREPVPGLAARLAGAPAYWAAGLSHLSMALEKHVFEFVPPALVAVAGASGWIASAVERSATLRLGARAAAIVKSPRSR